MEKYSLEEIMYFASLGYLLICSFSAWFLPSKSIFQYGRLKHTNNYTVNPKLGWFLMQINNLLWALYFIFDVGNSVSLGYSLFIIHYINRTLIYPIRMKSNNRIPLGVVLGAWAFTFANGYLQGTCNQHLQNESSFTLHSICGTLLFVIGMGINVWADSVLQKQKQKIMKKKKDGQKANYSVINEFLFNYVSNPNYFGQILQWFGYFLVCFRIQAFAFAFSTFNVLVAAARQRNQWNKLNIQGYPSSRKAVIPFLI